MKNGVRHFIKDQCQPSYLCPVKTLKLNTVAVGLRRSWSVCGEQIDSALLLFAPFGNLLDMVD